MVFRILLLIMILPPTVCFGSSSDDLDRSARKTHFGANVCYPMLGEFCIGAMVGYRLTSTVDIEVDYSLNAGWPEHDAYTSEAIGLVTRYRLPQPFVAMPFLNRMIQGAYVSFGPGITEFHMDKRISMRRLLPPARDQFEGRTAGLNVALGLEGRSMLAGRMRMGLDIVQAYIPIVLMNKNHLEHEDVSKAELDAAQRGAERAWLRTRYYLGKFRIMYML